MPIIIYSKRGEVREKSQRDSSLGFPFVSLPLPIHSASSRPPSKKINSHPASTFTCSCKPHATAHCHRLSFLSRTNPHNFKGEAHHSSCALGTPTPPNKATAVPLRPTNSIDANIELQPSTAASNASPNQPVISTSTAIVIHQEPLAAPVSCYRISSAMLRSCLHELLY